MQAGNTYGALNDIFGLEADSDFEGEILAGILNPESWQENTGDTDYFIETAWDIYSAGASLAELVNSIQEGNAQDSLINGGILLFDLAALFIPGLPGVGGFKAAANAAETGSDIVKAIAKNGDGAVAGAKLAEGAGDVATTLLLDAPKMGKHHIFPQAFNEKFADLGIDIHDFTISLPQNTTHLKGVHGNGFNNMPGKWNDQWASFFQNTPNATPKDAYQFAGKLLDDYGVNDLPIIPYK